MEEWKQVEGYNGKYEVSSHGRIRSFAHADSADMAKVLTPLNSGGYHSIIFCWNRTQKMFRVHQIVARAFIPNPDGKKFVNHINGIKTDNRVDNLAWITASENMRHAYSNGLNPGRGGRLIKSKKDHHGKKNNKKVDKKSEEDRPQKFAVGGHI